VHYYKIEIKNYMKSVTLTILSCLLFSFTAFAQADSKSSIYELRHAVKENINILENQSLNYFSLSQSTNRKSPGLAILYSLLLPGMGELYADGYNSGVYFTIAEGALWATFIGMNTYAGWQEDRYKSYAVTKAGIDASGKDKDFYSRVGLYLNLEQYNNEKALERNFDQMYESQQYFWKWNSTEERKVYRDLWLSSEQTFNDIRFVVGAMLLNRVASAINAVRLVSSYNNRMEEQSWNVSVGLVNYPNMPTSLNLNFNTSF
jgi:hypothetical protein